MRVSDSLIRLVLEMNEENSENETKKYKGGYQSPGGHKFSFEYFHTRPYHPSEPRPAQGPAGPSTSNGGGGTPQPPSTPRRKRTTAAKSKVTPTPTPTPTPTRTPTPVPTPTQLPSPAPSPTTTQTPTPVQTLPPTDVSTPTQTDVQTPTQTPVPTTTTDKNQVFGSEIKKTIRTKKGAKEDKVNPPKNKKGAKKVKVDQPKNKKGAEEVKVNSPENKKGAEGVKVDPPEGKALASTPPTKDNEFFTKPIGKVETPGKLVVPRESLTGDTNNPQDDLVDTEPMSQEDAEARADQVGLTGNERALSIKALTANFKTPKPKKSKEEPQVIVTKKIKKPRK